MRICAVLFVLIINFATNSMAIGKANLNQLELKQQAYRELQNTVYEINTRQKRLSTQRAQLESENAFLQIQIQQLNQEIEQTQDMLIKNKNKIKKLIRAAYVLKNKSDLSLAASSQGSYELNMKIKSISFLTSLSQSKISEYQEQIKKIRADKFKIASQLEKLQKQINTLNSIQQSLNIEQSNKKKLALKFKNESTQFLKLMASRGQEFEDLDFIYRNSFFEMKGLLPIPMAASLVSKYGIQYDTENKIALKNKGLQFKAAGPSTVKAVFDGKVTFVGELEGFGKTVIIDHGDHFYTTYSRLNEIMVAEEQEVKSGSILSKNSEQLYFEVRHFSEPTDPQEWLKGHKL